MTIAMEDFPDVVVELTRGGFDDAQTAAMIRFVGGLYSGQNEVIASFREEMRERFDQSQRETNARLDRLLYTIVALLGGQLVAIVGTVVALVL